MVAGSGARGSGNLGMDLPPPPSGTASTLGGNHWLEGVWIQQPRGGSATPTLGSGGNALGLGGSVTGVHGSSRSASTATMTTTTMVVTVTTQASGARVWR
uniref:Uncharacterized protein n=1 Tax=Oryza punctata TaxID=4537 RepID=A0A0E0LJW6_ORYPU